MSPNITSLLVDYGHGNQRALEDLLPLVYKELRQMAQRYLRRERPGHTLQPTALVHEAYFRLINQNEVEWQNRLHFFGVAAQLMRRILIDHARQKKAVKRGGTQTRLSFDEALVWAEEQGPDLVELDDALKKLAAINERQSRVVELRFFGGLNIEESAKVLNTSPATVKRDWTMAKAWLHRELANSNPEETRH